MLWYSLDYYQQSLSNIPNTLNNLFHDLNPLKKYSFIKKFIVIVQEDWSFIHWRESQSW